MKIIENNWGIANTYSDRIEINKNLNNFPELREKIIKHELEHVKANKKKGLNKFAKNRKVDGLTELKFKDLFPFFKKHPKAFFQQYAPITYSKTEETLFFEWTLIILYSIGIGVAFLIYKLISYFSTSKEMFWFIVKNAGIILGILFILYAIGNYIRNQTSKIDWKEENKKAKLTKQQKQLKKAGINPAMAE